MGGRRGRFVLELVCIMYVKKEKESESGPL